jgi:geranylgeranyl pyrophosphate synthase
MKIFADTLSTIVSGEVTQLFDRQTLTSEEAYFRRIYEKTASMFVLATRAAAVLSGSDQTRIDCASLYGHQLGMAFQIVDDILDFTGDQATVGKPVGSDLRQGIITLPAIYFQNQYPEDGRIQAVIDTGLSGEDLLKLIKDIREGNAIIRAKQTSDIFIEKALTALKQLPENKERKALEDLALYVSSRDI